MGCSIVSEQERNAHMQQDVRFGHSGRRRRGDGGGRGEGLCRRHAHYNVVYKASAWSKLYAGNVHTGFISPTRG